MLIPVTVITKSVSVAERFDFGVIATLTADSNAKHGGLDDPEYHPIINLAAVAAPDMGVVLLRLALLRRVQRRRARHQAIHLGTARPAIRRACLATGLGV